MRHHRDAGRPRAHRVRSNKLLLLMSSLVTLALLGWAAVEENQLRDWRLIQAQYRNLLPADARVAFSSGLRQIVIPGLKITDRCVSCHLGMAPGEAAVPGNRVFSEHPRVVHDPADFGCTVCHGGQGLATDTDDAHGAVAHWPEPMIPRRYAAAGCGSCHTHLAVPNLAALRTGRTLVERFDCLACHALDGRGGTIRPGGAATVAAPDLSVVGITGYDADWYQRHLAEHTQAEDGPWRTSFGPIDGDDLTAVAAFLASRVGAPGLIESKALFHSLGCRGCHKVGGVGGDDGPDLTAAGQRDPGLTDFAPVDGRRDLAAWFAAHFESPAAVVPGSQMPAMGLSDEEIDSLVLFTFSLRRSPFPEAFWPVDRIRAERFGEREFARDGATLYGTFCAACHGRSGEGMRYPGMAAFPAIANPDFLAVASDDFIEATVRRGRPGRRMPAWAESTGGLRDDEIATLVVWLRVSSGVEAPREQRPPRWVTADPSWGAALYAASCSGCHGARGEGAEGPALANPVLLETATDTYLVRTVARGRRGTSMEAFETPSTTRPALAESEIEAIVAFLRTLEAYR